MNEQALSRGQSEYLSANGTLYLVNQSYPFTVQFSGSASSASSSHQKKEAGGKESQQKDKKVQPKRNIKDFFVSSPKKVSVDDLFSRFKEKKIQKKKGVCFHRAQ